MEKRRLLINAIISVVQIIVISLALLIVYKFLFKTIGVKQLGIWSVVMASSSITQIANFGLSGSVVKFVAKYVARNEEKNVSLVIQTATISLATFIGLVLLICYPLIKWILSIVIDAESISTAESILPFALLSLWIMMVSSVFQAGLDGYQRIDLRSIILIASTIVYSVLVFLITPILGLNGLLLSQICQNLLILISSWILLRKFVRLLPIFPFKWDKDSFKEIVGYGVKFQIITATTMFYDPTTKALLSKFGGLSMVGYYEMASKMIQQIRALIVSANQVLVPTFADLYERNPEKIKNVYLASYRLLFYLSVPLYSLVLICAPFISELWIGHYENSFVLFAILLGIGWFLNTLAGPAYFANLGIGELRWNVLGHILIAVLNAMLGIILGRFYGGNGVVIAWSLSLGVGSSLIYLTYHLRHRIALAELVPRASRVMLLICLMGIFLTYMFLPEVDQNYVVNIRNNIFNAMLFSLIIAILLWVHPMRKNLLEWINQCILDKHTRCNID
jgi:O-antigen/teichoic acid export membrane protein